MKSVNTMTNNWSKNGAAKKQQWIDGINGVTENPMAKAAARADAMLAGVTEAVSSGRWARKLQSLPISAWSGPAVAKAQNFVAGFTGPGLSKYTAFANAVYPTLQASSAAARSAKQNGSMGSTARMVANANALRQWAGKGPID